MLAALLFGLEEPILTQCSEKEIKRYKRLAIFFLILISCGLISFYYFFYLLSQNYVAAFFGSMILSFIYFSILRFTIITINVSLSDEMTMKRMVRNYANTYRVILFSAFVFTILVPLIALFNHNHFTSNLNSYKSSLNAEYQQNRIKAKQQQLSILSVEIAHLNKQKNAFIKKLAKANGSMEKGLTEFEIKNLDTLLSIANNKLALKDSLLNTENELSVNQYRNQLYSAELPFYRFQLVFKNPIAAICLAILFVLFVLIIPFYIRVLVSKDSNYASLYKTEIKNRIINDFELTKKECVQFLNNQFSYTKINMDLYEDSPFNNKPLSLPYKKDTTKNLFEHFQKTESTISTNE
jgi:hypothetical protein